MTAEEKQAWQIIEETCKPHGGFINVINNCGGTLVSQLWIIAMESYATQKTQSLYTKEQIELYEFLYNDCIYESSYATISIHHTKDGAEKAMNEHKEMCLKEYKEIFSKEDPANLTFGQHQDWIVEKIIVKP